MVGLKPCQRSSVPILLDLCFKDFRLKPYLCSSVVKGFAPPQIALPQVPQKCPPGTLTVPHWQQ